MSIVKEIVETLGPSRDPWSRAEVEAGVLQDIDTLRVVAKMISRDAMHKAVDDARDLIKAIEKLQEKLRSATLSPYLVTRIELACPRLLDETERGCAPSAGRWNPTQFRPAGSAGSTS